MRWSFGRQLLYAIAVLGIFLLIFTGNWYLFFYAPPSCTDGRQNQNEGGVDCGGVCKLLCEGPLVSTLWSRAVPVARGVYHAVAVVRNPNASAETRNLPYEFSIFDSDNILIAERRGTMFLLPGEQVPLFEANILTGERVPARTFVEFGEATWTRAERPENPLRITTYDFNAVSLRLTAVIKNESALAVKNITVTALLYNAEGTIVGASQTILPSLGGHENHTATFTWQRPFSSPVIKTEIIPRIGSSL